MSVFVSGPSEDGGAGYHCTEWKHSQVLLPTGPAPSQPQHRQPHFQNWENIFTISKWKGHHWRHGASRQGENAGCSIAVQLPPRKWFSFTAICLLTYWMFADFKTPRKILFPCRRGMWSVAWGELCGKTSEVYSGKSINELLLLRYQVQFWNETCVFLFTLCFFKFHLYVRFILTTDSYFFCVLRPVSAPCTGKCHCSAQLEATGPVLCPFTSLWLFGESTTIAAFLLTELLAYSLSAKGLIQSPLDNEDHSVRNINTAWSSLPLGHFSFFQT